MSQHSGYVDQLLQVLISHSFIFSSLWLFSLARSLPNSRRKQMLLTGKCTDTSIIIIVGENITSYRRIHFPMEANNMLWERAILLSNRMFVEG